MNIAFIGIGQVGSALADALERAGHQVVIAARNPDSASVIAALAKNPRLAVMAPPAAVAGAEVVFLATPFQANQTALQEAGDLAGKVLVDCTNPVGPGLTHGLHSDCSGGEAVQRLVPQAQVVKAFTIYGFENFEDNTYPGYGDLRPVMVIAGDDIAAKQTVADLCRQLGWDPLDGGPLANSLHLEHMTLLWIKLARMQGMGPGFVWGLLKR